MGAFDLIDKRHGNKTVRLECENCGVAMDGIVSMLPRWFNGAEKVNLCPECAVLPMPTGKYLAEQRGRALAQIGHTRGMLTLD
jgi:hypothetical protein